ncbi:MAG: TonB-dependent receptor [Gemmatimonadota bacterium]
MTSRTLLRVSFLLSLALAMLAPRAQAAPFGPALVGTVKDTSGAPLAVVQVIVAEAHRSTTTDENGRFVLRGLPPGTYHLTTMLIGYRPGHAVVKLPASGPDVTVSITMAGTTLRLSAVNVTAASSSGEALAVTQATAELSGKQLQRTMGSSLAQTLASEPGMAMRYNGPAATMPVIRGLSGDRILVLQDGVRSGDLAASAVDHATSIDPLAAQRIEVVRGPASLLYGNNALGGVVNVISNDIPTDVPGRMGGMIGTQLESVNPGGALSAGLTAPISSTLALNLRGGFRRTEPVNVGGGGTLEGTSNRNWNGVAGLGMVTDRVQGGLALKAFDFTYGLPSDGVEEAGIRLDGRRYDISGKLSANTGLHVVGQVRAEASAQDYSHNEIEPDGAIGTSFKLRTQNGSVTASTHFGRATGTIGAQGFLRQYEATGEEALTPAANTSSGGVFVFQELPLKTGGDVHDEGVARLQLGARFDAQRIESKTGAPRFGPARTLDFTNVSGSLGLSVPMGEHMSLSGSVARAFRAPTVEELFSSAVHAATGSFEQGNPGLSAEQSLGADAVLRVEGTGLSGQLSVYLNNVGQFIAPDVSRDTTVEGETMPLAVYGQRDASLRGVEAQAEFKASRRLLVGFMGDLTRGAFSGGAPLPFMPAARVGGSLRWDDGRFNVGGEARHALMQDDVTGGADIATDAYTLVNLSAGWNLMRGGRVHTLTLRVDNLTDERYYDATSRIKSYAPNPGRNVALLYKVLF